MKGLRDIVFLCNDLKRNVWFFLDQNACNNYLCNSKIA